MVSKEEQRNKERSWVKEEMPIDITNRCSGGAAEQEYRTARGEATSNAAHKEA